MKLIKNKITSDIVYYDSEVDLFTIYHLNLKHNFPEVFLNDYEIIEVTDKNEIDKIKVAAKIKHVNGQFEYTAINPTPNYESQIDKTEQLQCQILAMQKKIDDLTQIVNDTKNAMTTLIKTQ